jgi:hypothetical protein
MMNSSAPSYGLLKEDLMMRIRVLLMILALANLTVACQIIDPYLEEYQDLTGQLLFQDDFLDPASGWDRRQNDDGAADYQDGQYRILVNTTNADVLAHPSLNFTDTIIEVDATKVGGDNDNYIGLVCRYQDTDNFYFFVISSDGYYGIGKKQNGQQMLIGKTSMQPTEVVKQGDATNHIQADCDGSTLRLVVNGQLLAETNDNDLTSGDAGLLAGSYLVTGTEILFDNFVVRRP